MEIIWSIHWKFSDKHFILFAEFTGEILGNVYKKTQTATKWMFWWTSWKFYLNLGQEIVLHECESVFFVGHMSLKTVIFFINLKRENFLFNSEEILI